jgi:hypothetical protein
MSLERDRQRKICEGAAARYRALLTNTQDKNRRRMLEEMIARELDAAAGLDSMPEPETEMSWNAASRGMSGR